MTKDPVLCGDSVQVAPAVGDTAEGIMMEMVTMGEIVVEGDTVETQGTLESHQHGIAKAPST